MRAGIVGAIVGVAAGLAIGMKSAVLHPGEMILGALVGGAFGVPIGSFFRQSASHRMRGLGFIGCSIFGWLFMAIILPDLPSVIEPEGQWFGRLVGQLATAVAIVGVARGVWMLLGRGKVKTNEEA